MRAAKLAQDALSLEAVLKTISTLSLPAFRRANANFDWPRGWPSILMLAAVNRSIRLGAWQAVPEDLLLPLDNRLLLSLMPRRYYAPRDEAYHGVLDGKACLKKRILARYAELRNLPDEVPHPSYLGKQRSDEDTPYFPLTDVHFGPKSKQWKMTRKGTNEQGFTGRIDLIWRFPARLENVREFERAMREGPGARVPLSARQALPFNLPRPWMPHVGHDMMQPMLHSVQQATQVLLNQQSQQASDHVSTCNASTCEDADLAMAISRSEQDMLAAELVVDAPPLPPPPSGPPPPSLPGSPPLPPSPPPPSLSPSPAPSSAPALPASPALAAPSPSIMQRDDPPFKSASSAPPPPSPPPSPTPNLPFAGPGRMASTLGRPTRQQNALSLLASVAVIEWFTDVCERTSTEGISERTFVYAGAEDWYPYSTATRLRPFVWSNMPANFKPSLFPTSDSFASFLCDVGDTMLATVFEDAQTRSVYKLNAIQGTHALPNAVRDWHNDLRTQGRLLITLTIDGGGVVTVQGLRHADPHFSVSQSVGEYYALWDSYVLPMDNRDERGQYWPKHMVTAGCAGRLSLTFRYGYAAE